MEKTQNQLTDIIARENGTDFNKSIKIAIADGEIDNNELKSLSRAYKENISGKIQITKENINQLKRSLNVWKKGWLWVIFKALNNISEYNPEWNEIITTLKEFENSSFDKENNTPDSSAKAISAIQWWLKLLGYDTGKLDWQFGKNTKTALMQFQKKYNKDNKYANVWTKWLPWPKVINALIKELENKKIATELVITKAPDTKVPVAEVKIVKVPDVKLPVAEAKIVKVPYAEATVTKIQVPETIYANEKRKEHFAYFKDKFMTWINELTRDLKLSNSQIKELFNLNNPISKEEFSNTYNRWLANNEIFYKYEDLFKMGKRIGLKVSENENKIQFNFTQQPIPKFRSALTEEAREEILSHKLSSYIKKIESLILDTDVLIKFPSALQNRIKIYFLDDLETKDDFDTETQKDIENTIKSLEDLQKAYPNEIGELVNKRINNLIQKLKNEINKK